MQNAYIMIQDYAFKNVVCEMAANQPRPQCIKRRKWIEDGARKLTAILSRPQCTSADVLLLIMSICPYPIIVKIVKHLHCTWWRHEKETFSALLAICAGNSPVTTEFPTQRPVTRSFGVFFYLHLNKQLSKQSWGWWYETPSLSLWRHCYEW